ncbi:hypothetical protein Tco_0358941 [Tanacetum coccineum]
MCRHNDYCIKFPDLPDTLASAEEDVGFGYAHDAGLPQALANIVGTIQTMEIKTQSYYEQGNFESFTCWKLAAEEIVAEDVRVDMEDSDEEATCDLDDDEVDVEGQSGSAMKIKKRYIVDESASE